MENTHTIIIMQGGPTTGKTTIGTRLAASLKIPYYSKDGVKEPIFDDIGCPTEWETDHPLSGRKMDDACSSHLLVLTEIVGNSCDHEYASGHYGNADS